MLKFLLGPRVTVVGQTQFINHPEYDIPEDGDDHTRLGAFAAKGCYDSYGLNGRSCEANQRAILEHRHGSVMEHSMVSLFIEGITRGVSLEINRHRSFAISQRSTRYTQEEDSAVVLEPYMASIVYRLLAEAPHAFHESPTQMTRFELVRYNEPNLYFAPNDIAPLADWKPEYSLLHRVLFASTTALSSYADQVGILEQLNPNDFTGFDLRKWARGKARNTLPHGLETRGTWSNNHRGWRWFIESRNDIHAEPEIRLLAFEVWKVLVKLAPVYYGDFEITDYHDGIPVLRPMYSKV